VKKRSQQGGQEGMPEAQTQVKKLKSLVVGGDGVLAKGKIVSSKVT